MKLKSLAIRCPSCGGISYRKCANVSHYAPPVDWCCHVCNHKIPTSNYTSYTNLKTSNYTNYTNHTTSNNTNYTNHTTSNNTNSNPKNSVCPACRGQLANYRPHLRAPTVEEDSTSNVFHKEALPWSIFEALTAEPANPVFPPITVGQPNSRTEHHTSPKTSLEN